MFICIPCTCTCASREQRIGAICMVPAVQYDIEGLPGTFDKHLVIEYYIHTGYKYRSIVQ